ncbi:hypothetical protein [Mesorhizobium sp. M1348]|uniref:hypothetical protein n=1 Tax=Mesorhizobium sp. M1348 TaxID=2957089 RepID=UPI0033368892
MRRIDADDELFASIARKLHFELMSFLHLHSRAPGFLSDLVIEPLADFDGPLSHGRMRLGRFDGRNSASTLAACRYGIMLPSRAVSSIRSDVARSGQISFSGANAATIPG